MKSARSLVLVLGTLVAMCVSLAALPDGGSASAAPPSQPAAAAPLGVAGGYMPITPARMADTAGPDIYPVSPAPIANGYLQPRGTINFVNDTSAYLPPSSYVGLIALNVTVSNPSSSGYLTVYGSPTRPSVPSLFFSAGNATSAQVLVDGSDRSTSLYNGSSGSVRVLVDVVGYSISASGEAGGFQRLKPRVLLNTSTGVGAPARSLAAHRSLTVTVPASLARPGDILPINVSVIEPSATGRLVASAQGASTPVTSLAFTKGQQSSNAALVMVPSSGKITLTNTSSGSVGLIATAAAVIAGGRTSTPGTFHALNGRELLDTAAGLSLPKRPLSAGPTTVVKVAGHAGVPGTGAAMVAVELVTSSATGSGYLSVFGAGQSDQNVFTIDYARGSARSTLYFAPVSASGAIDLRVRGSGGVRLQAYVEGYTLTPTVVAGRAVDSAGRPIPGMEVSFTSNNDNVYLNSTTDGRGEYRFGVIDPGPVQICLSTRAILRGYPSTGYGATCYPGQTPFHGTPPVGVSAGRTTTLATTLAAGGAIRGTYLDSTGHALPSTAHIDFSLSLNGKSYGNFGIGAATYGVIGLPAGTYTVCFSTSGHTDDASLPGYLAWCYNNEGQATATPLAVGAGAIKVINPRLSPGAAVVGTVTSDSGAYSSLTVKALQHGTTVRSMATWPEGAYASGGVPAGPTQICVTSTNLTDLPACYSTSSDGAATDVDVVIGQTVRHLDIHVKEGGVMTGTVTSGGVGKAGVVVTITDAGGRQLTATSSATGIYRVAHIPPGSYTVCAADGASQTCLTTTQGDTAHLTVTPGLSFNPIDISLTA